MNIPRSSSLILCLAGVLSAGPVNAELVPQSDGTVYDTDHDLSWLQNANLAASQTFGVADIADDGRMRWDTANAWVAAMNAAKHLEYSDWRLVNMNRDGDEFVIHCALELKKCLDNEYGHLYYQESVSSQQPNDYFENVQDDALAGYYWSGSEYLTDFAWWFNFALGAQNVDPKQDDSALHYVWPVRDGGAAVSRFADVPLDYWSFSFIETLADSGITAGCGNGNYCPLQSVTRSQMAVFLERGMRGSDYSPPSPTGNVFDDVAASYWAAGFIEQFFFDGITSGCGNNEYCPEAEVTRDQMAVFLLRAKHGSGYSPPPAIGVFDDVPLSHWAVHWIEQLAAEGITAGCGGGNYCPDAPVNRDQMAVFLVRTFGL